ncbi:MerR family transcriptional regulator [Dialister invisus]|uniref:MerR family transcriptional regulator n=1 Tax=Dialister invisus TaxID=218538 RepID=UPI00345C4A71
MENKELYFTTGELSKLTGLSKQLLIFYDKKSFLPLQRRRSMGIDTTFYLNTFS